MDLFLARPMMHAFGAKLRIVTVDINPTPCFLTTNGLLFGRGYDQSNNDCASPWAALADRIWR